jgi:hypothetical protein
VATSSSTIDRPRKPLAPVTNALPAMQERAYAVARAGQRIGPQRSFPEGVAPSRQTH